MLDNLSLDSRPQRGSKAHTDVQDYAQSCEHPARWPRPATRQSMNQKLTQEETATPQSLYTEAYRYRNSFATRTIPIWNTLPAHMAEADSIEAFNMFKSQLGAQALP